MLCQNCGKNEVNFRYTQIVNGVKKEMALCSDCANKMGIDGFDIPDFQADFNSILGDFFNDYAESALLPSIRNQEVRCKTCGLSYNDFINTGLFGCSDCYDTFAHPVNSLLKNLHGSTKHIGRKTNNVNEDKKIKETHANTKTKDENNATQDLQKQLDKAVSEERYEDAARIKAQMDELKQKGSK